MTSTPPRDSSFSAEGAAPAPSPAPLPPPPPTPYAFTHPELDLSKLQDPAFDHKDIYLLTFATDFSRHVLALDSEDCTAQQFYVKKETFKVLNLTTTQPTRIIRSNLGRSLAHVLDHGDRKLLFETINELSAIIGGSKPKNDVEARQRHCAVSILGHVYGAAGDSAYHLHQMAISALIKLLKSSSSHAGIRAAVFTALTKMLNILEHHIDEQVARDIWKQARNHVAADKGALVVIAACECIQTLIRRTGFFQNSTDFDKLETAVFKAIDSPSAPVRHAAADCITEALVLVHSEGGGEMAAMQKKKPKPKSLRRTATVNMAAGSGAEDDDIPSRPSSPAPGGRKQTDQLILVLPEILKILSNHYVRSSTSNRSRAGLGVCYSMLLKKLGERVVQPNYVFLVEHMATDILGHANIANNRFKLLTARKMARIVLEDVAGKHILAESGQKAAASAVINGIIKHYPQALTEKSEPTKETLIAALGVLSALISALGSAANGFAEPCRDGLLSVLQHPSYAVQVHTAAAMKTFVLHCPQQLLPCLTVCMNSLSRELSQLATGRSTAQRRCVGFAHGLAAALSVSPARPLHGAVDVNSRVLTMATGLLKLSSQSELRVSATQIQVAWILIGGLMALGPNFVKIHLSQLLLMWKNALPKPLAKDNTAGRSLLEASFLAHVRECALGSILAFLQYNQRLLTVDVSKRIAAMLQSTSAFLRTLPVKKTADDVTQRLAPALQLADVELMVQRRVLQCYIKLVITSPAGGSEALIHSNLLTVAISLFADPEKYGSGSLSSSIATAAGAFETIWEVGDNSGFGVTSLVRGFKVASLPGQQELTEDEQMLEDASPETDIDRTLLSPVCSTLEHDAAALYLSAKSTTLADPAATEVVNAAIQLFAFIFPQTPSKVQESILEQIKTFATAGALQRDAGRKAAIDVNVATALLCTTRVAARETKSPAGSIRNMAVEKLLQSMVRETIMDDDRYVRSLGYHAIARLCDACGNAFTNSEIKYLVDTVIANREPSARAGCAMAFGTIQNKVGGMAAGFHLKTIHSILITLANDPHPVVHYWALEALALTGNAAGLSFAPYVSSTLGMAAQMYASDTHNAEMASVVTMNLEIDMSSTTVITRVVDSIINVLGPDLQDSARSRELILTLVGQFCQEANPLVQQAALGCLEHLSLYAPGHMVFADYVALLQEDMNKSDHVTLRDAAVDGLYNVMKRNPSEVVATAKPGLENELWLVLDSDPAHDGIRNILWSWMRQTALTETALWLQRFQSVLKMTRPKALGPAVLAATPSAPKSGGAMDLQDEEVAGFAAGAGKADAVAAAAEAEPLRWQVITFAMKCLSEMFYLVTKDSIANGGESASQLALQARIGDVVRMAFSASTSGVLELRIWGLKIIGAVLKMFGKTPDPDFDEAMLLEQYQAQIGSALTPAFAADSSPELAAEAVNVCANFISTGIVTDVDRMGRILKTLVTALENFSKGTENAGIGDLKGLSSNAQVMVKMAVFAAWAELQVASTEQTYLVDVLRPHIAMLTPLWLESLREFARLRFEPDISMTLGPPSLSGSLDTIYAALNRETLLKFYQDSWLKLVDAIASLIEQDSEFVFDALDDRQTSAEPGTTTSSGPSRSADINYRDEPLAFFFVLFGIAFEALATKPSGQTDSLASEAQTLSILKALKKILHPSVSGHAIYRDTIFSETMDLLDRLALTDGLDVQGVIVEIARDLCVAHPSARKRGEKPEAEDNDLSEDIEQLFELTRIIVLVLSGLLPNLGDGSAGAAQPVRHQMNEEAMLLVGTGLEALVDAADVFPAIIQTDLHACIIHIFATMLATPMCQNMVVPQALPIFKRFVTGVTGSRAPLGANGVVASGKLTDGALLQLKGCLRRFLGVYIIAQRREQPNALVCVKNAMLASTILFTGGRNQLPASDPVVARYLEEVVDCLTDRMTAKIAAGCIRSLLVQHSPTPADHSIARFLLPRLIAFATNTVPEDPESARPLVILALTQYAIGVARPRLPVAFTVVIPAILAWAAGEGEAVYKEASGRLLELAAASAEAFKAVVGGLSAGQRGFLEEVVKSGKGEEKKVERREEAPTIELKMNFGV